MGQYILCTSELAKHPFTIRELGLRLYSGEELCYYIFHNLALIDNSFITAELLSFIELELDMRECAVKLRKLMDTSSGNGATLNQILMFLMRELRYYNDEELAEFSAKLESYKKMSDMERLLARGDALLERHKYSSAIRVYEQYLEYQAVRSMKPEDIERVWQHLAAVYMRMYLYEKGLRCLQKAYDIRADREILKQMYFLSMYQDVDLPADFFTVEAPETLAEWQNEYHAYAEGVSGRLEHSRLSVIMSRDSVRREKELQEYLEQLKRDYRESE